MSIPNAPASSPAAEAKPAVDAVIQAKELTKQFGDQVAVSNATFYVPRNSIFGFIGPSGSGKTTTVRMLTGYYAPTSGELTVFGRPPGHYGQSLRTRIGYMPQLFVLYPHLSVWENLNFTASIYGMPFSRRKAMEAVLEFVELGEHRHKLARDISGGMQRRLSLAATLVHDPELIFLDEPTAGIDPILRQKFWGHFRQLRDEGRTLFVTTQYVGEAAFCDLVGVMGDGRLITVNTPEMLRKQAYGGDVLNMRLSDTLDYRVEYQISGLQGVRTSRRTGANSLRLIVDEASTVIPMLMEWSRDQNLAVEALEEDQPPFDDVFVELVRQDRARQEAENAA